MPAESQQKMHQLAKEFFSLPAASKDCLLLFFASLVAAVATGCCVSC